MQRTALPLFAASCCLALVACASAPGGAAVEASASPKPSPSEVASSAGSAIPIASSTVSAPPVGSPFSLLVQTDYNLELWPVDNALFVRGGPMLTRVDGDKLVRDERMSQGLPVMYGLAGLIGRYPDDLHMLITDTDGRVGWGENWVWNADHWNAVGAALPRTWVFVGVSKWDKGQILALSSWTLAFDEVGPRGQFKVLGGSESASTNLVFSSRTKECKTGIEPSAMRALEDGSVFSVGMACGQSIVESWTPGNPKSAVAPIDGELYEAFFEGHSRSEMYLAGSPREGSLLYHFDGSTWKKDLSPDPKKSFLSLSLAKDGTLWAVTGDFYGNPADAGNLWQRKKSEEWKKVTLPPALPLPKTDWPLRPGAQNVYADPNGDVWATADGALYRTRPGTGEPQTLSWPMNTQFVGNLKVPRGATKTCESVFALFYGFTKVTPDDYDFPLTRKALKGQIQFQDARFVVTSENGHKFFGAFPKSYEEGVKMVARVKKEVSGSTPQLLCATPTVLRDVKIDLKTGEVQK